MICPSGEYPIKAEAKQHCLGHYDSFYLPRVTQVLVETDGQVDLAECSAEADKRYPLQVVSYADVEKNGSLKFTTRDAANTRTVNITFGSDY